jgi:hypothetical protein
MIRFSAIGLNHNHIYGQVRLLLRAGAELVSVYAPEPELIAEFRQAFPQASLARAAQEILEDHNIQLVVSASIPDERAPLGVQVMKHGKDFMSDKPGFTTLEQLAEARRVQAETGRIYSICFSERFEVGAAVRAGIDPGGRDWSGGADGRTGSASNPSTGATRLVLSAGEIWRDPDRYCFPSSGSVPVLHRFHAG